MVGMDIAKGQVMKMAGINSRINSHLHDNAQNENNRDEESNSHRHH